MSCFSLLSFKINMVPSRSLSSLLLRRLSVLWVDIVQMVFGADSIPIVPIYINFCENNEKLIIAWHVHDVTTYSLIDISINIPHFVEFHILPTSSVQHTLIRANVGSLLRLLQFLLIKPYEVLIF